MNLPHLMAYEASLGSAWRKQILADFCLCQDDVWAPIRVLVVNNLRFQIQLAHTGCHCAIRPFPSDGGHFLLSSSRPDIACWLVLFLSCVNVMDGCVKIYSPAF